MKVVFNNIKFKWGDISELDGSGDAKRGGAIDGYCTAVNCYFTENSAWGYGGAMDSGIAINCTFEDNEGSRSDHYGSIIQIIAYF